MEEFTAVFFIVCLSCYFLVNLDNILRKHKQGKEAESYAEIEPPSGFMMSIAALGTLICFIEMLLYPILIFASLSSLLENFAYNLMPFMSYTQSLGLSLMGVGYVISIWSVIARGRYAVSWEMRNNQVLVTWGPYRYVRHPSYLAYFLMFIGLFALWPNPFTLVPLVAIPCYFHIAAREEQLLAKRFGEEYREYQKKTGRFVPKIRK
jgi:protein-S-isoprenylcysteine O-methyltransferase Ste14